METEYITGANSPGLIFAKRSSSHNLPRLVETRSEETGKRYFPSISDREYYPGDRKTRLWMLIGSNDLKIYLSLWAYR